MEINNMNKESEKLYKILFICLGNICRSPAANAVMQKMVDDAGLSARFLIDSAGIGNWHVGELPDKRMRNHGFKRGYQVNHIARQFDARTDFEAFDYIIVMDEDNYKNINRMSQSDKEKKQVIRMIDYITEHPEATSVPDPYYGEGKDFDYALDLIEDGCRGLLQRLCESESTPNSL
ncbi:low molecular weight protein-tyrosine-phosphatase [Prevotella sp. HUN102]|uniref:low molecular weight protein-tyrosine-phosphatase n=1 Tax=Prevotella sp. HUN102 TaxID=1392486 RepID=UPI000ADEE973|nr:low molecular weight protein-tyrosine-phosphatase [Prevotella sp. HUN102]